MNTNEGTVFPDSVLRSILMQMSICHVMRGAWMPPPPPPRILKKLGNSSSIAAQIPFWLISLVQATGIFKWKKKKIFQYLHVQTFSSMFHFHMLRGRYMYFFSSSNSVFNLVSFLFWSTTPMTPCFNQCSQSPPPVLTNAVNRLPLF